MTRKSLRRRRATMFRRGWVFAWLVLQAAAVMAVSQVAAQDKTSNRIDELMKSIGLVKTAVATAADLSLGDPGGGTLGFGGQRPGMVVVYVLANLVGPV